MYRAGYCATRDCSRSVADVASRLQAHRKRGAVVQRAKELLDFARHHGYRLDELIEIIEDVG